MIKFIISNDEGLRILCMGVTNHNVDKLVEGNPIYIRLKEMHNVESGVPFDSRVDDVMIIYGESREDLTAQVKKYFDVELDIPEGFEL